ncbi:MAG: alpha/beta fold hydrolase [Mucilaginibacter sp.]|nr:alpha/beta fold hydrolase [Mucilaginibacter sp.]
MKPRNFLIIVCGIIGITGYQRAAAGNWLDANDGGKDKHGPVASSNTDKEEISAVLTAHDKNAIFSSAASFTFEVKNPTDAEQTGKVSYLVINEAGKVLHTDSVKVKIAKNSSEKYDFEIPESNPGFYRVNFMVNVTDYDDTTRRAFGIRPQEIRSPYERPADFDAFWQTAKDELAKVKPEYKVTLMPKLSTKTCNVYLIQMQSLDNITVRAWLTEPVVKDPKKKFAVILALPGYQIALPPMLTEDKDVAFITLNVRGQGNSREFFSPRKEEYVIHHIEDKNKYVMRGVIMDCIRAMDFIYARPEFKHDNIFVKGGSMGGYLAIATAGLDKRVNLCSAQSPIFADIRSLVTRVDFPINYINMYLKIQPGLTLNKILNNLDYFDAKNFAPNISCKFLMSIGLLDTYVPPTNDYVVFNSMTTNKKISIFKNLGHEVGPSYIKLEGAWMHDEFGLFY